MAFQTPVLRKSFVNNAATVVANRICVFDATNGGAKLATASTDLKFVCVSEEATDSNSAFMGTVQGIAQVVAGGTVSKGDYIEADASAKAVAAAAPAFGGVATKQVVGIAMNAAAAGELVDVLLQPFLHRP